MNDVTKRAPQHIVGWCALGLAIAATGTAVCVSAVAGFQRGGWPVERILWTAISVTLVLAAHLMPSLLRTAPLALRFAGTTLWAAAMFSTCYGHATFFLLAQQHAGTARAAVVATPMTLPFTSTGRGLSAIAADHADTVAALARSNARRCTDDCAAVHARRVSLQARLDALTIEADEAKRKEDAEDRRTAQEDRTAAQRDEARNDPVTTKVAELVGVPAERVDLLSGMGFSLVLELLAAFTWSIALGSPGEQPALNPGTLAMPEPREIEEVPTQLEAVRPDRGAPPPRGVASSNESVAAATLDDGAPVAQSERPVSDIEQLAQHVAAGRVRATVAGIRRHLGCSQKKALELRRQLLNESQAT